jgi:beta-galactosidase/beta-glucuronidase
VREGAYLGRDVANLRAAVERERAARVDPIAPLPVKWRFALDPDDVGQDQEWFAVGFDDSEWKEIEIGKTWEEQGYEYDGFAWYRVQFEVKPEWLAQGPLALHFGAVDGEAWVYWGGEFLGQHEGWDEPFALQLKPETILTDKPNLIAIRVFDGSHQGGIWKPVNLIKAR